MTAPARRPAPDGMPRTSPRPGESGTDGGSGRGSIALSSVEVFLAVVAVLLDLFQVVAITLVWTTRVFGLVIPVTEHLTGTKQALG